MRQLKPKLPSQCDVCKREIKLYSTYYTLRIDGHFCDEAVNGDISVLCPVCYKAYEDFLFERLTQENHKRTMEEMKGAI